MNPKYIDIFPTTIVEYQNPSADIIKDSLIEYLDTLEYKKLDISQPWQTIDLFLHKDPNLKNLYLWINECIDQFHKSFQFDCDEFKIMISWANKTAPGGEHHVHTHPNSYVSGIYYISSKGSPTAFSDPRLTMNSLIVGTPTNWLLRPWISESQDGTLLLFPSWLEHYTIPAAGSDEDDAFRYTISLNVIPTGKVNSVSNPFAQLNLDIK